MTRIDALGNWAFLVCSGYSAIYPEVPTMAEIFSGAGYSTGMFGKWHLGDNYPYRPMDHMDPFTWKIPTENPIM